VIKKKDKKNSMLGTMDAVLPVEKNAPMDNPKLNMVIP